MKTFLAVMLVLTLIIGFIAFAIIDPLNLNLFGGFGRGSDSPDESRTLDNSAIDQSPDPIKESDVVEIKVEEDHIFFDGEPCADTDTLKQKIIEIGQAKEYRFLHTNAIKKTYDEVQAVLSELEEALGIEVN